MSFARGRATKERHHDAKLVEACKLVLLFHSGSPWDKAKQQAWNEGMNAVLGPPAARDLPTNDPTTKNLCNAVRAALASTTI